MVQEMWINDAIAVKEKEEREEEEEVLQKAKIVVRTVRR